MGVKISLGKFISTRRKQKFMTQEELANKMHVSKSAIAKWETDGNASFEEKEIAPPNITQDVIQLLEAYGYEVIRPEEKRNIVVKIKEEER